MKDLDGDAEVRPGKRLEAHLRLIREVAGALQPVSFRDLTDEVVKRAKREKLRTSCAYITRVIIATTANIEPARVLFPCVRTILVVGADGRFGLK